MTVSSPLAVFTGIARAARMTTQAYWMVRTSAVVGMSFLALQHPSRKGDVYNILWALVFGFATLNILTLAAKRFEPHRRGLTFGEMLAVLVVVMSIFLLGWELLYLFHVLPIKLKR